MGSTFFVCPACGKCHDIDCEIKDGAIVRCSEAGHKYLIRLIYDARPDEPDLDSQFNLIGSWIKKAAANITKLVAGASLKGTAFSNTQVEAIIQQEYKERK